MIVESENWLLLSAATIEQLASELSKRGPSFLLLLQTVGSDGIEDMSATYSGLYASLGMAQAFVTRTEASLKSGRR